MQGKPNPAVSGNPSHEIETLLALPAGCCFPSWAGREGIRGRCGTSRGARTLHGFSAEWPEAGLQLTGVTPLGGTTSAGRPGSPRSGPCRWDR